jgi:hypothetical protein
MSWVYYKRQLKFIAKEIDPSIILTTKANWFWILISYIVLIVSFGKTSRKRFLEHTATAIGPIVGIPSRYSREQALDTLHHEGRHVYQARILGFWIPYVGPYLGAITHFFVLYCLLFPVGFNWFRYRFELDAYSYNWKRYIRSGWNYKELYNDCMRSAESISSWVYAKPIWKSWAVWGFKRRLDRIIREYEEEFNLKFETT